MQYALPGTQRPRACRGAGDHLGITRKSRQQHQPSRKKTDSSLGMTKKNNYTAVQAYSRARI